MNIKQIKNMINKTYYFNILLNILKILIINYLNERR